MDRFQFLKSNLDFFQNELASSQAKLIAVSKTYSAEDIKLCYEAGQRDFGENRVQELLEKAQALKESCPKIRWHLLGHLQSNKLKILKEMTNLVAIHSIDSLKLIKKLKELRPIQEIGLFLQVNTSNEEEKSGFKSLEELTYAASMLRGESHLKLWGLMTMGKIRTLDFESDALSCFGALNSMKKELERGTNLEHLELSMGMSRDYKQALKCGTNWVRIGSSIFGKRE